MGNYYRLVRTVEDLIDAAITWQMSRDYNFHSDDEGGFLRHDPALIDPERIPGRGGSTGEVLIDVSNDIAGHVNPATEVYAVWEKRFRDLFEPWFYPELPDQVGFQAAIDNASLTVGELADATLTDDEEIIEANQNLSLVEVTAVTYLASFTGHTVGDFKRLYLDRFAGVRKGQFVVALALYTLLRAEQRIWLDAQGDIAETAEQAVTSMRGDAGGWTTALKVVGSIAAVTSIFTAGTTAVVAGAASTAIGIFNNLVQQGEPVERTYAGSSPDEVFAAIKDAVRDLKDAIADQESSIERTLSNLHDAVAAGPGFNLARPSLLDLTDPRGVVAERNEIALDPSVLRTVGREDLPMVGRDLMIAADALDPTVGSDNWFRRDGIGLGTVGPQPAVIKLSELLARVLDETGRELIHAGETLAIAADVFEQTDAEVMAALERHRDQLVASTPVPPSAATSPWLKSGGRVPVA